eukprot:47566_1
MNAVKKYGENLNKCIDYIESQNKKMEPPPAINNEEKSRKIEPCSVINTPKIDLTAHELPAEINLDECKSIEKCAALKSITELVRLYHMYNNIDTFEKLDPYLSSNTSKSSIINCYHHILQHVNEDVRDNSTIDKEFKFIQDKIVRHNNLKCDIDSCKIYKRNNRQRETHQTETHGNKSLTVFIDLLDSIHCYFIHSYDSFNLKNMKKFRGNNRCIHNKFMSEIAINFEEKNESKDTAEQDTSYVADVDYSFGERYDYWEPKKRERSNNAYVERKYDSLKLELINNKIYNITVDTFDEIYEKANILNKTSNAIKKLRSNIDDSNKKYAINHNESLNVSNIFSVISYTDLDTLSYNFSKTFRTSKRDNSEYWWWSKILCETVNSFGIKMKDTNINIFYHGVSKVYFKDFNAIFSSPTSTTTKLQIANIFTGNEGVILELKKRCDNLRYFNCSFVSAFGHEKERLFINPPKDTFVLEFNTIRNMSTNENYKDLIDAIKILDNVICGYGKQEIFESFSNTSFQKHVSIPETTQSKILKLLNWSLEDNKHQSEFPEYMLKTFSKWSNTKTNIIIHLPQLHKGYKFLTNIFLFGNNKNVNNLPAFDKINKIFKRLKQIQIAETGEITGTHFELLPRIFEQIKTSNFFSRLRRIEFWNVSQSNASELSDFIKEYAQKCQGTNWEISKTSTVLYINYRHIYQRKKYEQPSWRQWHERRCWNNVNGLAKMSVKEINMNEFQ